MALPARSNGYVVQDDDWNAHVSAINANTDNVSSLDGRVTTAEGNISSNDTDISNLGGRIDGNDSDISSLNAAVGMPYSNADDLDTRVTTLEDSGGGGGGGSFGAWQTPTLESGWTLNSLFQPVKYRTIPGNRVEVIGHAQRGSSAGDTAFTLPYSFRGRYPTTANNVTDELPRQIYFNTGSVNVPDAAQDDLVSFYFTLHLDF